MKTIFRVLLALLAIVNVYMLISIILFKTMPLQLSILSQLDSLNFQLQLVMQRPSLIESRIQSANFIPFYTISSSLSTSMAPSQWLNLYGNVLIFIPTGVIIGLWKNKQRIATAAQFSFLLSLTLESMQLIFLMGSFDVDDLILNTCGGTLGACFASLLMLLRKQMRRDVQNAEL